MTKRATLSLSSEEGKSKEQASDLKPTSNNKSTGRSTRPKSAKVSASPNSQTGDVDSFPQQHRDWPDSRRIVKAIVVVATAALALYIIRRRFI